MWETPNCSDDAVVAVTVVAAVAEFVSALVSSYVLLQLLLLILGKAHMLAQV